MPLPTGLVCSKCGRVFGAITNPPPEKLQELKAVCVPCVAKSAEEKNIKLDSPEGWEAALKD
jgi:hypothetical protein